jgi:RNA polymerase-binding transcription factor
MTADELAAARAALLEAREAKSNALDSLSRDFEALVRASADANADDEHDPEGSTIAFERAQLSALLDSTRDELAEIESALNRIETGSYGRCEVCGAQIAAERLAARPATRRCVRCAAARRPGG